VCTVWAGTGETRLPGLRRAKNRMYMPMVKASGGQRESEGVVVPLIGVQHNASGGKDMRENRTYGLKGGWGNGPFAAPRP